MSSSPAAPTGATGAFEKATFEVDKAFFDTFSNTPPPVPHLACRLNPKSLSVSGGGEWKEIPSSQDREPQPAQFTRSKPRTMNVEVLVDQFAAKGDVSAELEALADWTMPRASKDKKQASAPWVCLKWGTKRYFRSYIANYKVTYTLFSREGKPLRATVSLTLNEAIEPAGKTNPTSGGIGGERVHVVEAGDSLQLIAYRHYGKPHLWRGLASFNGIDDPLRIGSGDAVALPEVDRVEELSGRSAS